MQPILKRRFFHNLRPKITKSLKFPLKGVMMTQNIKSSLQPGCFMCKLFILKALNRVVT